MDGVTEVPLVAPGTDLSLITLFLHADIVVKLVMLGLLIVPLLLAGQPPAT